MHAKARSESFAKFRCRSAANPLPAARNSAAGRHGETVTKLLIYNKFAMSRERFSNAETRFSPAIRERVR
jgi:hypothetical protein